MPEGNIWRRPTPAPRARSELLRPTGVPVPASLRLAAARPPAPAGPPAARPAALHGFHLAGLVVADRPWKDGSGRGEGLGSVPNDARRVGMARVAAACPARRGNETTRSRLLQPARRPGQVVPAHLHSRGDRSAAADRQHLQYGCPHLPGVYSGGRDMQLPPLARRLEPITGTTAGHHEQHAAGLWGAMPGTAHIAFTVAWRRDTTLGATDNSPPPA